MLLICLFVFPHWQDGSYLSELLLGKGYEVSVKLSLCFSTSVCGQIEPCYSCCFVEGYHFPCMYVPLFLLES